MLFRYKAIKDDKIVVNKIEGQNEQAVLAYLKDNKYFPIEVKPVSFELTASRFRDFFSNRLSPIDIIDLTRQLAIMLNAGLSILDSLRILEKQVKKPALKKTISIIDEQIRAGNSLSTALRTLPDRFSNLYIALIKAGEASGKLSEILLRLSENLEKDREVKSRVRNAMIYPAIIIFSIVVVIFVMLTFVMPKLLSLYKEFDVKLPWTTQILISISDFFVAFWPIIIGATVGLVLLGFRFYKTKRGRYLYDSFLLEIPVLGEIFRMNALIDSIRTLSVLIGSGVSMLESLTIIIETTGNTVFQGAYRNVLKNVERGTSLGVALENEEIFPPILVQMATVGENTGHLDDTLLRISKYFEIESEIAIKTMTALIEPAILMILGVGVGFLVLAVITPIYNLTASFQ